MPGSDSDVDPLRYGADPHPKLGTVETRIFDQATRTSRQISPARIDGPSHDTIVRPFAELGFKGYMTRWAFFTGDTRVMFRGGIDEVLFRVGFGVDF